MIDCRDCIYHIGKKNDNPRFMWSHCKGGISNLTLESASKCKMYANTLPEALKKRQIEFDKEQQEFAKRFGREWDYKCPCCGGIKKWEGC